MNNNTAAMPVDGQTSNHNNAHMSATMREQISLVYRNTKPAAAEADGVCGQSLDSM